MICQDLSMEKLRISVSALSLPAEIHLPLLRPYQRDRADAGYMN